VRCSDQVELTCQQSAAVGSPVGNLTAEVRFVFSRSLLGTASRTQQRITSQDAQICAEPPHGQIV
jgi:hypothetical protein